MYHNMLSSNELRFTSLYVFVNCVIAERPSRTVNSSFIAGGLQILFDGVLGPTVSSRSRSPFVVVSNGTCCLQRMSRGENEACSPP